MALSWGHIQLSVRVRRLWGYCIRCKRRIYVVYAAALLRGESSHALADELLPASSNKGALPCDEDTIKDIPGVHYPATGYRRISVANQKKIIVISTALSTRPRQFAGKPLEKGRKFTKIRRINIPKTRCDWDSFLVHGSGSRARRLCDDGSSEDGSCTRTSTTSDSRCTVSIP